MIDLFTFEQVIPELLAQFYGDITKGAFATDKFLEVIVNAIPFLIFFPCLCPEVGEEIYLCFACKSTFSSGVIILLFAISGTSFLCPYPGDLVLKSCGLVL